MRLGGGRCSKIKCAALIGGGPVISVQNIFRNTIETPGRDNVSREGVSDKSTGVCYESCGWIYLPSCDGTSAVRIINLSRQNSSAQRIGSHGSAQLRREISA